MKTYFVVFGVKTAVTFHIRYNWEGCQPANG